MANQVKTIFTADASNLFRVADQARAKIQSVSGFTNAPGASLTTDIVRQVRAASSEVDRINRQTAQNARQQQKIIELATKQRIAEELRAERAKEREQKRITNNILADMRRANQSRLGGLDLGGLPGAGVGSAILGGAATGLIISELTKAGAAALDYSSKLEQTRVGFNSLIGNSEKAAKHLKELRDLSTSTPLEFLSIAKLSQRLQGAGVQAERIAPLIRDIGNIAAATGDLSTERIEGIGIALSQIASKGKVSAEELEQLAERGIPGWRILSESIGKTAAETRKLAEDGKISSDQLFTAFQRFSRINFGDALQKQSSTFSGALAQIRNIVSVAASETFAPFYKEVSNFAINIAEQLKSEEKNLRGVFDAFGQGAGQSTGDGLRRYFQSNDWRTITRDAVNLATPHQEGIRFAQNFLTGVKEGTAFGREGISPSGTVLTLGPDNTLTGYQSNTVAPPPSIVQEVKTFEAERLEAVAAIARARAQAHEDDLNLIREASAAEEASIKKQIELLTQEKIDKGEKIKLETQLAVLQINTQKQIEEVQKRQKEKTDEIRKNYTSVLQDLSVSASRGNAFTEQMFKAADATQKIKEQLKDVPASLRAAALEQQSLINSLDAYQVGLQSKFNIAEGNTLLRKFTEPTKAERQDALNRQFNEFQRVSNSTNPDVFNNFYRNQEAINQFERINLQRELDEKLAAVRGARGGERSIADREIVNLARSLNPDDIRTDQRQEIGEAIKRDQEAKKQEEAEGRQIMADFNKNLAAFNKLAAEGKLNQVNMTVHDPNGAVSRATSPTPQTVNLTYSGGGGLTNF